jgi:3'(2'), 5'-bisphosphate nucleotidase
VGSRSHGGSHLQSYAAALGDHELVVSGSSLKLCLVADGGADVYPRFGPTSEWDTAAAQAVVECAGGQVTTLDGKPLSYNRRPSLLNPYFMVFSDPQADWFTPIPAGVLKEAAGQG